MSGLVRCELCDKALTAAEAKGGKYSYYYVCQSILNGGSKSCETPRLNAGRFERLIIEQLRDHVLTESNIRELVKMLDEEMDGVAREERERLEMIEAELEEVRRKMDRLWHIVESSDMEVNDILPRLRVHQERQAQLEESAEEARSVLAERRELLDSADVVARFRCGDERVPEDQRCDRDEGVHPVVREADLGAPRPSGDPLHDSDSAGQPAAGGGCSGGGTERRSSQYGAVW